MAIYILHTRNKQETLSRALQLHYHFDWVESQQGSSCLSMPLYTHASQPQVSL